MQFHILVDVFGMSKSLNYTCSTLICLVFFMNVSYYALKGTIEFGPEVTGKQQSAKLLLNSDDAVSYKLYLGVSEGFFFKDLLNSLTLEF